MTDEQNILKTKWWFPVYKFFVHVVVGTIIFLIIAIAAVGISCLVHYLEQIGIDSFICIVLRIVEYLLFVADIVCFIIFLIVSVRNLWRELWER